MTDDDRPWTPDEAASWFSVSEVTIRRWVREGRLRRIPTGGALRITAASIAALTRGYDDADGESQFGCGAWIEEREVEGASEVRDKSAADAMGEALG